MKSTSPSDQWLELKKAYPTVSDVGDSKSVLAAIESIDKATPWSEVEPKWWLEMMAFDRELRQRYATQDSIDCACDELGGTCCVCEDEGDY